MIGNRRNKHAVSVLNKLDIVDDNPVGLIEDNADPSSANFGVARDPRKGGYYYFTYGATNNHITERIEADNSVLKTPSNFVVEFSIKFRSVGNTYSNVIISYQQRNGSVGTYETGGIIVLREASSSRMRVNYWNLSGSYKTHYFDTLIPSQDIWYKFIVTFNSGVSVKMEMITISSGYRIEETLAIETIRWTQDGEIPKNYIGTFLIQNAGVPTGYFANNINSDFFGARITDTDTEEILWEVNCDENSGDTAYDSSGNGNHGQIIDAITVPPEDDPNSIHQYQNIKSYHNDEGYSILGLLNTGGKILPSGLIGQDGLHWFNTTEVLMSNFQVYNVNTFLKLGYGLHYRIYVISTATKNIFHGGYGAGVVLLGTTNQWLDFISYTTGSFALLDLRSFTELEYNEASIIVWSDYTLKIPKDNSVTLPPFKDVLGNDLQYFGSVPAKASFKESACFLGDVTAYIISNYASAKVVPKNIIIEYTVSNLDTTNWETHIGYGEVFDGVDNSNYIQIYSSAGEIGFSVNRSYGSVGHTITTLDPSKTYKLKLIVAVNVFKFYVDETEYVFSPVTLEDASSSTRFVSIGVGYYNDSYEGPLMTNTNMWNVKVSEADDDGNLVSLLSHWPLCEPIINPSSHTYYDVVGGNHATLINGTTANEGTQDEFHYLQKGFNNSIQFDGIDDYLNLTELDITGSQNRTVAITYIYFKDTETHLPFFSINQNDSIDYARWTFKNRYGTLRIEIQGNGYTSTLSPNINKVNNIACVLNGTTLGDHTLYLNGNTESTLGTEIVNTINNYSSVAHSMIAGEPPRYAEINLYRLAVWDRALSTSELDNWFNGMSEESSNKIIDLMPTTDGKTINKVTEVIYSNQSSGDLLQQQVIPYTNENKDALDNPLTILQDNKSFLNTGCKLQHYDYPALRVADEKEYFWFVGTSGARKVDTYDLGIHNLLSNQVWLDKT